ncbi:MAG: nucleoid-associated protein YgaU [Pseudohongiellaceae bacterium]|jgi:nucleoid-associated protein YgaU
MKKSILGGILMLVLSLVSVPSFSAGDTLALKADHPQTYVVKKGDTLWAISGMFLRDPWLWPKIWHVNPQLDNPHLIYPGDELNLVWINGQPRLVVKRGRDVKLSPSVRISELAKAIPAIPMNAVAPFLSNSRVLASGELEQAPHILAGKAGHIISGAGDELYARGDFDEKQVAYGVFRKGEAFVDPDSGELLGVQALSIAGAKLIEQEKSVATLALNATSEEVRRGDRLLPDEDRDLFASFHPSAPNGDINGYIIAVEGGVSQIGLMDVVVINKGTRENVEVGQIMAIYRQGELVRDVVAKDVVKVPDSRAGLLMVFRTFEKVSYALVLKATQVLSVTDKIKNP